MAEKHKSKYKAPKDFEKSQKPKPRKDIKDYTEDDKKGGQNPRSTGDAQLNVLRKRDKEMVDTGDMYVKYNDDDRLYKDIETGDYDPKTAAKRLKKRQDTEEKETKDVIKDKIENLTREQKERLVREYVRRKIVKVLLEQPTPPATEEEPATEEPATDETPIDPAASTTPGIPGSEITSTTPAAETTPTPAAATPTPGAETTPTPGAETTPTPGAETTPTPQEIENRVITNMATELEKEGAIGKIKAISKVLKHSMKELDTQDQATVFRLLRQYAIKKLSTLK